MRCSRVLAVLVITCSGKFKKKTTWQIKEYMMQSSKGRGNDRTTLFISIGIMLYKICLNRFYGNFNFTSCVARKTHRLEFYVLKSWLENSFFYLKLFAVFTIKESWTRFVKNEWLVVFPSIMGCSIFKISFQCQNPFPHLIR